MFKKLLLFSLIIFAIIGIMGCSWCKSDKDDDNNNVSKGSISGIVRNINGYPISNAIVTVGALKDTTNEQGYFKILNVNVGQKVVRVEANNYLTTFKIAEVLEGQTYHFPQITLLNALHTYFQSSTGGTATSTYGQAIFSPNSFVRENGSLYTGQVNVEMNAYIPGQENFFTAFPGPFEGIRTNGQRVSLISYGFMTINVFGTSKDTKLNLASDKTAELRLSINDKKLAKSAPDTMPMWYFDENAGIWKEEGYAVKQGYQYVAHVRHLSSWNWDLPSEDICMLEGYVKDVDNNPVANARVISQNYTSKDFAVLDEVFTDNTGKYSVRALKNSVFKLWAIKGSYQSDPLIVNVGSNCPQNVPTPLILREPAFSITLTWGEKPNDLDSHLFIPISPTYTYHLYYGNMGSLTTDPFTVLDTDDVSSYGPEIISGFKKYNGVYKYYVHNYSGESSWPILNSGATVTLEAKGEVRTYQVSTATPNPNNLNGTWHVFDFKVENGQITQITDVNKIEPMSANNMKDIKNHIKK